MHNCPFISVCSVLNVSQYGVILILSLFSLQLTIQTACVLPQSKAENASHSEETKINVVPQNTRHMCMIFLKT